MLTEVKYGHDIKVEQELRPLRTAYLKPPAPTAALHGYLPTHMPTLSRTNVYPKLSASANHPRPVSPYMQGKAVTSKSHDGGTCATAPRPIPLTITEPHTAQPPNRPRLGLTEQTFTLPRTTRPEKTRLGSMKNEKAPCQRARLPLRPAKLGHWFCLLSSAAYSYPECPYLATGDILATWRPPI